MELRPLLIIAEVCAQRMASRFSLLELPDIVLVQIFSHIQLAEFLQTVSRTCRRLNEGIKNNLSVWKDISMYFCVDLNKTDLQRILRHSRGFETFLLPYAHIECCNRLLVFYQFGERQKSVLAGHKSMQIINTVFSTVHAVTENFEHFRVLKFG